MGCYCVDPSAYLKLNGIRMEIEGKLNRSKGGTTKDRFRAPGLYINLSTDQAP